MDKNLKKFSLRKINEFILILGIGLLFFRVGNFSDTYLPKPFEVSIVILFISSFIYFILEKKIKEFLFSIPKKIILPLFLMIFSILIGWIYSEINGETTTLNMFLEFGTFLIAIVTFLFVIYYSNKNGEYRKYLLSLLSPIILLVFIILPDFSYKLGASTIGGFNGATTNVNITSKMLLIPAIYFIGISIFELKNKWYKFVYVILASGTVGLIFWTCSRGSFLGLIVGVLILYTIYIFKDIPLKDKFFNGIIIFLIFLLGFLFMPQIGKKMLLNRMLNLDDYQLSAEQTKEKTIKEIIIQSIFRKNNNVKVVNNNLIDEKNSRPAETRFQIWPHYFKKITESPLGYGPNTHMESNIPFKFGGFLNTGPHNSYMQIWLWGGVVGIVSFIYLLYQAFKRLFLKIKKEPNQKDVVILFTILSVLCFVALFDDTFTFYNFWVVLALAFSI